MDTGAPTPALYFPIAVQIRRALDSPRLKTWNIARPFRLRTKQVGTHRIGGVQWLLSRLTLPIALDSLIRSS